MRKVVKLKNLNADYIEHIIKLKIFLKWKINEKPILFYDIRVKMFEKKVFKRAKEKMFL